MKITLHSYNWGEDCIRQASALASLNDCLLVFSGSVSAASFIHPSPSVHFHAFPKAR